MKYVAFNWDEENRDEEDTGRKERNNVWSINYVGGGQSRSS